MTARRSDATSPLEPTRHELKTWPGFFEGLIDGTKTAEIRRNDRNFKPGDFLTLREFNAETDEYTGRMVARSISRVDDLRLVTGQDGFVLLSFAPAAPDLARRLAEAEALLREILPLEKERIPYIETGWFKRAESVLAGGKA
jgi:hypothetical protein